MRSIPGGVRTCHEWWLQGRRRSVRRGQLWNEFEHTRPLSDPELLDETPEVMLEQREQTPLAAEH